MKNVGIFNCDGAGDPDFWVAVINDGKPGAHFQEQVHYIEAKYDTKVKGKVYNTDDVIIWPPADLEEILQKYADNQS